MSKRQKGDILMSRLTRGGQVTVPLSLREELRLQEGTLLQFERQGNQIIMTPVSLVPIREAEKAKRKRGG